jgi:hypothetical protein
MLPVAAVPRQLPFLEGLPWSDRGWRGGPLEMLQRYEAGWRWRGVLADPTEEELAFVRQGYAEVRDLVRQRGAAALFVRGTALRFPREPTRRTDCSKACGRSRPTGHLQPAYSMEVGHPKCRRHRQNDEGQSSSKMATPMWTPVRLSSGTTFPYGFGWNITDARGHRVIWHTGGGFG